MSVARRYSRPSSASSHRSVHSDVDLKVECRAAFMVRYDDLNEDIESKEDLVMLLQETGRNVTNQRIQKYWTKKTESLSFDDFVDICRAEPATSEDDLMRAFRKIDINGDGYISLEELYKIMTSKGEKMSKSEVRAMIDEVDENKDGKLDYREFSRMVMSTTEEFKKMSIRVMEKKEKKRTRKRESDAHSLTHMKDKDETSLGSQLSVRSAASEKRSRHRNSVANRQLNPEKYAEDEMPRPSPRGRRESRPKSSGKGGRSNDPSNLNEWTGITSKGAFFLDEDQGMLSHVYSLNLTEDSDVWITIQPLRIAESGESLDGTVIDTALFVLNEDDNSLVAFTENKDSKGKYSLRCSLSMGTYTLLPFTTGCRLRPRKSSDRIKEAKLVTKDREDKIVITRAFKKALEEIFEMADLDNNGLLSRDEFNWYNLRTSGEEVADDEWQVVEDNIELERGEITRSGFIKLNEMEADDNDGDTEDLWITLSGMGFNKSLLLDEACPFMLKVYTQDSHDSELTVTGLEPQGEKIKDAVCEFVTLKGEAVRARGTKDVTVFTYQNDSRASIVVENKSKSRVKIELDCSRRPNLVSSTGSLLTTLTVPAQSTVVGCHILPMDNRKEFSVSCEETILK